MILGIDGTNWVHVLWHAKSGRGVVEAFTDRALAVLAALDPRAAVCCFDRRSFRHGLVPTYKSSRKPRDESLTAALHECERSAAELMTVAAEDGAEADDGLATLANWARQAGEDCVIASPDKDLRQCLAGRVKLLRNFSVRDGRPVNGDWYTQMLLFDELGLDARQWIDYQMLTGDRGDSIDGCKGWGEKTAAAALAKCKSLEAMFASPWTVPCTDRQRGQLIEFRKRADLVRQLVTLRTDVESVFDALR
jgi:5'-3' exonuclease